MIEPWIGEKIQTTLNESNKDFIVEIGKIRISIFRSELELENITISSKPEQQGIPELKGEIESIKIEGINITKAIFKKDFEIKEVTFFNSSIKGQISFHRKEKLAKVSPFKVRIDTQTACFFGRIIVSSGNDRHPDDSEKVVQQSRHFGVEW